MDKTIIRSKEEISTLIKAIKAEYDDLPAHDAFGYSNAEEKALLEVWLGELLNAQVHGIIPDSESDAEYWLTNKNSFLAKDFGVE